MAQQEEGGPLTRVIGSHRASRSGLVRPCDDVRFGGAGRAAQASEMVKVFGCRLSGGGPIAAHHPER
jgi:hypothetical protein